MTSLDLWSHLSALAQPPGRSFVATHSIHALAVVVPVVVIVGALYWDRIDRARKRWFAGHRRHDR